MCETSSNTFVLPIKKKFANNNAVDTVVKKKSYLSKHIFSLMDSKTSASLVNSAVMAQWNKEIHQSLGKTEQKT